MPRSDLYLAGEHANTGLSASVYYRLFKLGDTLEEVILPGFALLLFWYRPRDPVVAFLSIYALLKVLNTSVFYSAFEQPELLITSLIALKTCAGIACFYLGIIFFPDGRVRNGLGRFAVALALVDAVAIFAAIVSQNAWLRVTAQMGGILTLLLMLFLLVQRFRDVSTIGAKQQLRWAGFGLVVSIVLFVSDVALSLADIGRPVSSARAWADLTMALCSGFGGVFFALGFVIAMLEYRLYDAESVISRSAGYAIITGLLALVFAVSEKVVEFLGQDYFGGRAGVIASGIAAGIAALIVTPAHGRIHRWAEERFQKALVRLRTGLPAMVDDLREVVTLPELLGAALARVQEGLRAQRVAITLIDNAGLQWVEALDVDPGTVAQWYANWHGSSTKPFDCDRADHLFPARVALNVEGRGRIGWLLIGPRPDGSFIGRDERATLVLIASPVARAIEVARRRARWVETIESRLNALEHAISHR